MPNTREHGLRPGATRAPFGTLPDNGAVEAITLRNARGLEVVVLTYGATIHSVRAPDREGKIADVALGHADLSPYLAHPQFMGSTVGRVANRIAGGRFVLDGCAFQIPCNDGDNALHGGPGGFDKANWSVIGVSDELASVTLAHLSPDGDQGFPGNLQVTATFALDDDCAQGIENRAKTDRPTLVNITNHAYWNLAGEGSSHGAMNHRVEIFGDHFLPTDATAIPTGEFRMVAGTAFDFRTPALISARLRDASEEQIRIGRGYDHSWVLARDVTRKPRPVARVVEPASGRVLEVSSDQPGLQFYSGNFLDGTSIGKAGRLYRMGDAFALEPQMFPDTPNQAAFGSLRLEPGQTYRNRIIFRFTTDETT